MGSEFADERVPHVACAPDAHADPEVTVLGAQGVAAFTLIALAERLLAGTVR